MNIILGNNRYNCIMNGGSRIMKRRNFLGGAVAGSALLGAGITIDPKSALAQNRKDPIVQENGKYDLLLKGGHVIDPANNINKNNVDVAIAEDKIALVGSNIPATQAKKTLDMTNLYVTPGFIDIHAHIFYTDDPPNYRWIIADDICWPAGCTTVVDPGSSGAGTFENLKKIIESSNTRTLALINNSYTGMDEGEQDPRLFKVDAMVEVAKKYPQYIVGFKTAHYWGGRPYDDIHTPWAAVDAVVEAGRKTGLPSMFDFNPRPPIGDYPARSYRELILERSNPTDIHTHCFAAHIPSITPEGKVNPDIFKAMDRGFIFDLGHGAGSFVYKHAVPAFEQGYYPNTISTDLHSHNTNGPVINMSFVMSKMLSLGMSLEDLILRSTINPAKAIQRTDLGSLTVGGPADVAVFEILKGNFSYLDTSGGKNYGDQKINNIMTVAEGRIGFDPYGVSYPYWRDVPKDSRYWRPPAQTW